MSLQSYAARAGAAPRLVLAGCSAGAGDLKHPHEGAPDHEQEQDEHATTLTDGYVTRRKGEKTHADTFVRKLAEKTAAERERGESGKGLPSSLI